jgi:probable rRNA maturation factor
MINIDIDNQTGEAIDLERIKEYCKKTVNKIFKRGNNYFLEIVFVKNQQIAKLNRAHLKHKGTTDIISFPNANREKNGPISLGSLVIAPEYLKAHNEEMEEVILHGLIHLFGLDHETDQQKWSDKIREVKNGIYSI